MRDPDGLEPGRPVSLGGERDAADAADLLGVLRAVQSQCRSYPESPGLKKIAREALWWIWEHPRLPRPLIRSKYPVEYPWSPQARAVVDESRKRGASDSALRCLIIEHLIPWNLTMTQVLDKADSLEAEQLAALLTRHGAAAVITTAEDKRLAAARVAHKMPEGAEEQDVWARYRAAGLVIETFAPIADSTMLHAFSHARSDDVTALVDAIAALEADTRPFVWTPSETETAEVCGVEQEVITPSYPDYSESINRTIELLYRVKVVPTAGWQLQNEHPLSSVAVIRTASLTDIARWLTVVVRGERFGDGEIASAIEDGRFVAALQRLSDSLTRSIDSS